MAAETTNRKINIWINDKQVINSYKGISNALRKTRNELANMTFGTREYYNKVKDLKKLQGILDQHNAAQGRIATGWRKIRNEIKQIAVGNLIANAVTMAAQNIGRAFNYISQAVGEAEQGLTNVLTLLSDSDIEKYTDYLKAGADEIMKLGFTQADTNKALFDAVSSGVEAGKSIDFLRSAAVLAKGGVTQLGIAVDGMTSIMNAYGLSVADSANIADAFFTSQKWGKTTVEELAASIGKVAPIASALGVSYQELLSASARLTLTGISTHESMTYLKAAMSNLMKPAAESIDLMKKWNIPMGLSAVRTAGFTETLRRLNEVVKKSPDDLAKIIPSIEGQNAVLALAGKGFESYQTILNDVMKDVGANSSLQKAFTKQLDTLPNIIAKAKGELTSMAISVGTKLAPAIKAIMPYFTGFIKSIIKMIDFITENIKIIKLIATATLSYVAALKAKAVWLKIVNTYMTIQKNISLLLALAQAKLEGNTTRAAAAQKLLNISMKANPIGLIVSAVSTLITAYFLFKDSLNEVKKAGSKFNDMFMESEGVLRADFEALKQTKEGTDDRRKSIEDINSKYGKYLNNLLTEKSTLQEIEAAQRLATDALRKDILVKAHASEIEDAVTKALEKEKKAINQLEDGLKSQGITIDAYASKLINDFKTSSQTTTDEWKLIGKTFLALKEHFKIQGISYGEDALWQIYKAEKQLKNVLDGINSTYQMMGMNDLPTGGNIPNNERKTDKPDYPDLEKSSDLWDKYIEKYKQFRDEINKLNKEYSLEGISAWEKEFIAAKENYEDLMVVTQSAIDDLEEKSKTKQGLNDREAELLKNFYDQQVSATDAYEKEIQLIIEKYSRSREDVLADEKQKEINQVKQKYDELIAAADRFGIDYADLRVKMLEELKAIDEKYAKADEAQGKEEEIPGLGTIGKIQDYVSKVKAYADQLSQIWSAYNDRRKNEEDAYLARVEDNNEKQKRVLQQRLDFGLISETEYTNRLRKNEQRLELEKKRIARDQAIREKRTKIFEATINTISAAVEALPNYILAALIGVTGAASIAAIASEPIPQMAKGARVNRPTIAMVGERGREIVLSNSVVDDPVYGPFADDLARIQEGKQPRFLGSPSTPNYGGMNKAIASTNIVNNTSINQVDTEGMDYLSKKVEEMTKAVLAMKYLQAVISDKELTDRDKDKELLLRYSKF